MARIHFPELRDAYHEYAVKTLATEDRGRSGNAAQFTRTQVFGTLQRRFRVR